MIDWNNVLYAAVVLDDLSQEILKRYLNTMLDGDNNNVPSKIFCHHMTVGFGKQLDNTIKEYVESNLGEEYTLTPVAFGISDKACAIQVETNAPTANKIKHITLCTFDGGKPVDSNNITNWRKITLDNPIVLKGTLKCIFRNSD